VSDVVAAPVIVVAGQAYPPTLSTDEAAALLGCHRALLQAERGKGTLPVEPLQLGNRLRWPTLAVAEAVGLPAEVVHGDSDAARDAARAQHDGADSPVDQGGKVVGLSGRRLEGRVG
jgi:hypothetical protein